MLRAPGIRYVFIERKRGNTCLKARRTIPADILSDIYSHRNLKIDFRGLEDSLLAISSKLLYNKENSGIRAKMSGSFLTGAGRRKTENYEKT